MLSSIFVKDIIKRGSNFSKTAHKVTKIVAETKEYLQCFDIGGGSSLLNCLSFLGIWLNSAT